MLLRIEDHDRQRCRPEYETALLDDLDRLGIAADEPSTDDLRAGPSPYRQSDNGSAYEAAVERLRRSTEVYACDCSRSTFAAWREPNGRPWTGAGCPGGCRSRALEPRPDLGLRAALGDGDEAWADVLLGSQAGPVAPDGDLLVRDRNGNWTYALCVVVDDLRHGVDLVVRGEDLVDSTPAQIRLLHLLGRPAPPDIRPSSARATRGRFEAEQGRRGDGYRRAVGLRAHGHGAHRRGGSCSRPDAGARAPHVR